MYWFDVNVAGPATEAHAEALGEVLTAADGIDATIQAGRDGGSVMFSREADDAVQAIISAVMDVEKAGMTAIGVTEDLVTAEDIADRARVTAASARYWISGDRGPGDFPAPRVARPKASLYSWADVSAWLHGAKLGEVDHVAVETARACALISAALVVRRGLAELPKHERPLVARLVA
ncbi:hypothetical protein [Actinoallomurus vinaceus]